MKTLSRFETLYGRDEPPAEMRELRAGPLTVQLDGPDLRYIRAGQVELVRRIYVAVRDQIWSTIPGVYSNFQIDAGEDRFTVRFDAHHHQQDIDFSWQATITGAPDGTIGYRMDGLADSDFLYNRIGICVLHPPQCAGRPFRGVTPNGEITGTLPALIGPQRIENGTLLALFPSVHRLTIALAGDLEVRFAFEGDLFEMEDQRNWTDGSFKTYSTPLALPFPKPAANGQEIRQSVTISIDQVPAATSERAEGPRFQVGEVLGRQLPPLGLAMPSHEGRMSPRELDLLRELRLDHLRVDLHLQDETYPLRLEEAVQACSALHCRLDLALFVTDGAEDELTALAPLLRGAPIARVLVFHEEEASTAGRWVRLARELLRDPIPDAPFAGGTNAYFTQINAQHPEIEVMDAVAYSLNPQVHAFDDISLVETMEPQARTVETARSFCGDRPLIVGPITLRPRLSPAGMGPAPQAAPGELPPQVDPRQMSLLGAAWTVGSIKYLAESGADSLTYFETTGWRGVMETEAGSPLPQHFPSSPGMIFPMYHVFADLGEWKRGELIGSRSSNTLRVDGLVVRSAGSVHILLANLTPGDQAVTIEPISSPQVSLRRLNVETARDAMFDPERFRSNWTAVDVTDGKLRLELDPYETIRVEAGMQGGE